MTVVEKVDSDTVCCGASTSLAAQNQRGWRTPKIEVLRCFPGASDHLQDYRHSSGWQWDAGLADLPLHGGKKSLPAVSEASSILVKLGLAGMRKIWRDLRVLFHLFHHCLGL